jgi:hypothetical protein
MKPTGETHDRREFLRGIGRWLGLGALAALAGALLVKSRSPRGQANCADRLCRGCRAFDVCELPQALAAREAGR